MGFQVTTQDGYILNVQRIPVGRSSEVSDDRVPVLLQHGLLMVSNLSTKFWFSGNENLKNQ